MFNPKTPLQASFIFLGGVGFIAWTITDIKRFGKENSLPPTQAQEKELAELHKFIEGARRKAAVAAGDPKRLLQRSRRGVSRRAGGGGSLDPYKVLDIPRNSSKAEVRAAYLEQMKLYHPDISLDEDSAEIAVQLNAAYQQLMEGGKGRQGAEEEPLDVFDFPEAEPSCVFLNPFSCNVKPLDWRTLQEFAEGSADPVAALGQNGVFAPESAVHYLTPGQLAEVAGDMEDMEESLSYEVTAWVLMDKLGRARRANDRMPVPRS